MSNDLTIKSGSLNDKIAILEDDINEIENVIKNVYDALLTLDETKWNTKEKKKIDEEFVAYMGIMNTKYPDYLRRKVDLLKKADVKYQEVDLANKQAASELDDLI